MITTLLLQKEYLLHLQYLSYCNDLLSHDIFEAILPRRKRGVEEGWLEGLARWEIKTCTQLLSEKLYWMPYQFWRQRQNFEAKVKLLAIGDTCSHFAFPNITLNFPAKQFGWNWPHSQQEKLSPDWPKPSCVAPLSWPQWLVEEKAHIMEWMCPSKIHMLKSNPNVIVFGGRAFGS